jgi:SPFH domain / Band 7 family
MSGAKGSEKLVKNMQKGMSKGAGGRMGGVIAGLGLLTYATYQSLFTVPGGHRSVVFSKFSGVKEHVFTEGTHFLIPGVERDISFNVRVQPRIIASRTGSKDLQIVKLKVCMMARRVVCVCACVFSVFFMYESQCSILYVLSRVWTLGTLYFAHFILARALSLVAL